MPHYKRRTKKVNLHVLPVSGFVNFAYQTSEYQYFNFLVPWMQELTKVMSKDKSLRFNLDVSTNLLKRWIKDQKLGTEQDK